MSQRLDRLARLAVVRKLAEDLDRRQVQAAAAAKAAVERALEAEQARCTEARGASREALATGDRAQWMLAEAGVELSGWNRTRLEPLQRQRESEAAAALAAYLQSRQKHEEIKTLMEREAERKAELAARKAQAAADEWVLTRHARGLVPKL